MNIPTLRQMRRGALARRKAIDSGALGYIGRHHVQRAKTFWEASRPSWRSGWRILARLFAKPVKAAVLAHPAIIAPAAIASMLRRPAGAHRAARGNPARRVLSAMRHRSAAARQSAPARLPGRRKAALNDELTRTQELAVRGYHVVRRHAADVGKRRGLRLIPEVWSIA